MTKLDDNGWVLWKFAGGQQTVWQIAKLRKMLLAIHPDWSDEEIERKIFRHLIPDDYTARTTWGNEVSQ